MEPTDSTIAKQTEQRKVALVCLARDNAQRDYPARDYISNKNRARRDLRNALSELVFNSQGARHGTDRQHNCKANRTAQGGASVLGAGQRTKGLPRSRHGLKHQPGPSGFAECCSRNGDFMSNNSYVSDCDALEEMACRRG